MNHYKQYFLLIITILIAANIYGQQQTGYYLDWNTDHTRRTVKPAIQLNKEEAKIINCYKVSFDENGRFKTAEHFVSGHKSTGGSYGAHTLEVQLYPDYYEEFFRDKKGNRVANKNGVWVRKYHLNEDGYWTKKEHFDKDGKLIEEYGVAVSKVQRDYQNRMISEIRFNVNLDTIPDVNDFKVAHFTFNKDGFITSRQNINENGLLENGKYGYAKVIFHIDQNGQFYGEEFLDKNGNLANSNSLGYAKIDMRDFNQYGKNKRFYFTDESGYPSTEKAMGVITYNANMTKDEVIYYDRYGNLTKDPTVRAKSKYFYDENGEFIRRENYNCKGELIK